MDAERDKILTAVAEHACRFNSFSTDIASQIHLLGIMRRINAQLKTLWGKLQI